LVMVMMDEMPATTLRSVAVVCGWTIGCSLVDCFGTLLLERWLLDKSGCHLSDESFGQFVQDLLKALPKTGEERLDIDLSYNYIHGMPGNNKGVDANLLMLAYHQVVRSINITFNPIATVDRINLWLQLGWTGDKYPTEQQKCHCKIIWIPAAFVKSSAWTTMVSSGQEDAVREYHLEYYSRGLDQQVLDALKQQPH
jgi:hypothetical protein